MTTTHPTTPAAETRGALTAEALHRRADEIEAALEAAGDAVDPDLARAARRDLETVRARLALGVDHTVAALVGGTGSGKSSLFNAVSRLRFADVGVLRPTTDEAAACTWGDEATELLDFLGVSAARRIRRDSPLDADREADLQGLVLLDMPDHDSVATAHWTQVDRLLPLVDVLVWVLDPQKYADHVLHERYLRELAGRREAMVVVVNQVDTLPPGGLETIVEDVRALLAEDGLGEVAVLPTSATERTGVDELRHALAEAVSRPSVAALTAGAALDDLARRLAAAVAPRDPVVGAAAVAQATAELARAAGVGAVTDSIAAAVAHPGGGAVARAEAPAAATVAAARSAWLARAVDGLPERWAGAVRAAVPQAHELKQAVTGAVTAVPRPETRVPAARAATVWGVLAAVVGVAAAVALVVLGPGWVPAAGAAALGLGLCAVLLLLAGRLRRREAVERSRRYDEEARAAVRRVVEESLLSPTDEVLARHRRLREALTSR